MLELLTRTGSAAFALSSAGHILGWNRAAERLFGFRHHDVLGRPCHQVVQCQSLPGQGLGPANCLVLEAIRRRVPLPAIDLLVRHRSGHIVEVSGDVILLPGNSGDQALVLLRPTARGVSEGSEGFLTWSDGSRDKAPEPRPRPSLDVASVLDRLLLATGADAAELFLSVPPKGQLVMAGHRGGAPRAFRQIVSFDRGQGFPGLVAQTGEPLLCLDLLHDDRYLRTMVKRQGFRFYLCVPVWGDSGFVGSLHIASRRHAETVAPHLPFLVHVAGHLGGTLERHRLYAAELATHPFDPTADASMNLRWTAERALQTLMEVANLECGVLLLCGRPSDTLQPVSEWGITPRLRRALARACQPTGCPALVQHRCVLPSDIARTEWALCRAVQHDLATALCLPLEVAGKPLGVALLGSRRREPLPTRHLSLLHRAVDRVAVLIHNAQVAFRQEREARMTGSPPQGDAGAGLLSRPMVRATTPHAKAQVDPAADIPFLDLRCLGRFTITSDGRQIPAERFARRRSLTLLKVLLTRYGKQVHREELLELLWPEKDPDSTNALLNVVVHYLRQGLEPNLRPRQPSHFVVTQGNYYAFDTNSPHCLDSQEFLRLANLSSYLEMHGQPAESIEACRKAIALYTGDFFEDELYSDWCALDREYLRETFLALLRRAARLQLRQGDVDTAVAHYRRALLIDPTLEDIHRALMEALWREGRRDEALRQYRECRLVLKRELGIAPLPETRALAQRIGNDL